MRLKGQTFGVPSIGACSIGNRLEARLSRRGPSPATACSAHYANGGTAA